jgi:hypothetical protein
VALLVVAAAAALAPAAAHAQRGGDYVGRDSPGQTPRTGFPGVFNTHMAEESGVVANVPLMQLDYGLSGDLTAGINLLPAFVNTPPGAIGRMRYRLHSAGALTSVATVMVGYGRGGGSDYVGALASKAMSLDVAAGHTTSAAVFGLSLRASEGDERDYATALGFSLDHDWFFNDRFGLNATVVVVPVLRSRESSPANELAKYGLGLGEQTFVRALAVIKPAGTWLVEVGGAAPINFEFGIPWLEVSKRW